MKVLTTEQQANLIELLEGIQNQDIATQNQINYWKIELKPKRVRRLPTMRPATQQEIDNQINDIHMIFE